MTDQDEAHAYTLTPPSGAIDPLTGSHAYPGIETALFTGPFVECVKAVWAQGDELRARSYVRTADWLFDPEQLEDMRREDEGEV